MCKLRPLRTKSYFTNKDLDFSRSNHFVLTYDWNISNNLRLKAEAYYQSLSKIPVEQGSSSFSALNTGSGFGPSDEDSLVSNGSGRNIGLELTLERFFQSGLLFPYYILVIRFQLRRQRWRQTKYSVQYSIRTKSIGWKGVETWKQWKILFH